MRNYSRTATSFAGAAFRASLLCTAVLPFSAGALAQDGEEPVAAVTESDEARQDRKSVV